MRAQRGSKDTALLLL